MLEFIFMLTRDDVTLADAREVYASVAGTGVSHVGCKDVGLPELLSGCFQKTEPSSSCERLNRTSVDSSCLRGSIVRLSAIV